MMKLAAAFGFLLATSEALSVSSSSSRRDLLQQAAIGGAASIAGATIFCRSAQAMVACPRGSQNCIRTTWTPPAGTSKADVVDTVMTAIKAYPQTGQGGVDNTGYVVVEDTLVDTGYARVEYQNFGNFAKFLNGGKAFVDDLVLELDAGNQVQVRSSSRVGDSDLGVNQKRLVYFGNVLKEKGWTVPEPKY